MKKCLMIFNAFTSSGEMNFTCLHQSGCQETISIQRRKLSPSHFMGSVMLLKEHMQLPSTSEPLMLHDHQQSTWSSQRPELFHRKPGQFHNWSCVEHIFWPNFSQQPAKLSTFPWTTSLPTVIQPLSLPG